MATRARATIPLLFLLATGLLFAAAVVASREEEEGRRGEHWLRQCEQRCQKDRPRYQRAECVQECRQEQHKWEQEQEQGRGRRGDREREGAEQEQGRGRRGEREREGEEQQESRRPYVFGPRSFQRIVRSEQGFLKALRPFNEESRLLRGIKNYRVAILEANPRSFVVPGYTDAHSICYVAQGEGVLTLVENGEKRSYAVRQGDVVVAPAGSLMHLANTDGRRKLVIAKILHTISVPGKFELFSAESLVSSLSQRVQRAAFKTSPQRLEKVFGRRGQKKKGSILRASEEQIRELRQQASEGGQSPHWPLPPFGGDSRATYNLLQQRPTIANRHGRLYEADARSFRALADHDVRVAFANISAGSMTAPYYNTQSVKIAVVLEGEGEVEIVCPHLSQDSERRRSEEGQSERGSGRWREEEDDERERQQQRRGRRGESESESESEEQQHEQEKYETVRARVSRGSVFVVPPGHPVVEISSSRGSSNLQVVCFEIRAENNDRVFLAGKNNVLGKLDKPAKELAFGAPEREVDEVLGAQQEEGFLAGPEQQQERGEEEWRHRGDRGRGEEAVESLLRMATGAF